MAWLDTIERLDTLLLEIRHFQCNVIFSLRLPILYQALTFEEGYLWGAYRTSVTNTRNGTHTLEPHPVGPTVKPQHSWFAIFEAMETPSTQIRELADAWIIHLPLRSEGSKSEPGKPKEWSPFVEQFTDINARTQIAKNIMNNRKGLSL